MNSSDDAAHSPIADGTASRPDFTANGARTEHPEPVRPTGVTVVGVLCTMAGILGLLSSLGAVFNVLFGEQFTSLFSSGGPMEDLQAEMNEKMATVLAKYFVPNLLISVAGFALGVLLLTGGVAVLLRKRWSRMLLQRTLLVGIIYELLRAVLYGVMQFEIMPITQEYMAKMASGSGGPGGGALIAQMSTIMMVASLVFWGVWTLIKLALMAWGRGYLKKPHLDAYFGE